MKKRSQKPKPYSAPALEKGLDILEFLTGEQRGSTLSEIASALGRTRTEIFRMVTCLEDRGYIARKSGDERYELTARLFALAHRHPPTDDLLASALPILRELASKSHQSCKLALQHEGSVLVIAQVDAPGSLGIAVRVGTRLSLPDIASGHALLALQEPSVRKEWLRASDAGRWSAVRKRAFEQRLARVARRGYEEYSSPMMKGVVSVSSPVCNQSGHAIATVTVHFARLSGHHPSLRDVRRMAVESAILITREIGGVTPFSVPGARARSRRAASMNGARGS